MAKNPTTPRYEIVPIKVKLKVGPGVLVEVLPDGTERRLRWLEFKDLMARRPDIRAKYLADE